MKTARDLAREMVARFRRQAVQPIPRRVDVEQTGHLNAAEYERFRKSLESRGYTFLGDFECLELDADAVAGSHPEVFRYMLSSDRYTCAGYHQTRHSPWSVIRRCLAMITAGKGILKSLAWLWRALPHGHFVDFESAVGTRFLGTSNAMAAAAFDSPPEVDMVYIPTTNWEVLCEAHEKRLRSVASTPPTRLVDLAGIWDMEDRVSQIKHAWRESRGIYTLDELTRLTRGNAPLARELHAEIQAIVRGS